VRVCAEAGANSAIPDRTPQAGPGIAVYSEFAGTQRSSAAVPLFLMSAKSPTLKRFGFVSPLLQRGFTRNLEVDSSTANIYGIGKVITSTGM
jgi:hypothetical protein